jgi:AraC family transcriptional regulator, regulatory protein of adaptative response / methylated-DNA-[protein]-cysteine methyltransferase
MTTSPLQESARQYATVARAIAWLRTHSRTQPTLAELAQAMHLSEFHLQRLFSAWAGISPKRFLQHLAKEHARQALRGGSDLLSVAVEAGLSGPGRLHDLLVTCEAMSPGEIRSGGQGVALGWGLAPTPFGDALLAWTPRGLCHLVFHDSAAQRDRHLAELQAEWPAATLQHDDPQALAWSQRVFRAAPEPGRLHLVLRGTNFQLKVWEALLRLAPGEVASYGQLAGRIGQPGAARAVGSALAANRIGYLIPCHRVIRDNGELSHYRWGVERKAAMLGWEAAREALQPGQLL